MYNPSMEQDIRKGKFVIDAENPELIFSPCLNGYPVFSRTFELLIISNTMPFLWNASL